MESGIISINGYPNDANFYPFNAYLLLLLRAKGKNEYEVATDSCKQQKF